MIELFINNSPVDLDSAVTFGLTYQSTDTTDPTAVKNSFSKQITLKGTQNNCNIFSNCYELDYDNNGDFKPYERVPFELMSNDTVIECGYIKLDTIESDATTVDFKITLYGMLGDYFYNLMYDSDGEKRTLKEVAGFDTIQWNADFIDKGWQSLRDNTTNNDESDWIKACPTYSGTYDDFDNDKFLIHYSSLNPLKQQLFPAIESSSSTTSEGYILGTAQREMVEWEARDLRSLYQRPCVKLSELFNRIIHLNTDYKTIIDDDVLNSPYWKNTFILFDRLSFDEDTTINGLNRLTIGNAESVNGEIRYKMNPNDIDLSGITDPHCEVDFNVSIETNVDAEQNLVSSYRAYGRKDNLPFPFPREVVGGYLVRLECYDDDKLLTSTPQYLFTTKYNDEDTLFNGWEKLIKGYSNIIPYYSELTKGDGVWNFKKSLPLQLTIPSTSVVHLYLYVKQISFTSFGDVDYGLGLMNQMEDKKKYGVRIDSKTSLTTDENYTGYWAGTLSPSVQSYIVTPDVLFGNSKSPFDYLISFTKLLNLKWYCDYQRHTVRIMQKSTYYTDEVIDLTNSIDRSDLKITPLSMQYKSYLFKLPYEETYADALYNRRNEDTYGSYTLKTPYMFSNESKNLYEDNSYNNYIPYLLSSIFFNKINFDKHLETRPSFTQAPSYTYTGYDNAGNPTEYTVTGLNKLNKKQDSFSKICLFDKDNANVEVSPMIVFYNGFARLPDTFTISDNNRKMIELNENPCYLIDDDTNIPHWDYAPVFSKYLTDNGVYTYSLDFEKPKMTFIDDEQNYTDDCVLISKFWKSELSDMYSENSKVVECNVHLPNIYPIEAMRKFYFFDNALWHITEISDFEPLSQMIHCKFIKVQSMDNYIN